MVRLIDTGEGDGSPFANTDNNIKCSETIDNSKLSSSKVSDDEKNNNIITLPEMVYESHKNGFGYDLFEAMMSNKRRVAQYLSETNEVDYYDDFLKRCIRTSLMLTSKGIKKGDIITICSNNNKNTNVATVGAIFSGVIPSGLATTLSVTDVGYLLDKFRPKIVFVSIDSIKLIDNALKFRNLKAEIVVFGKTDQHTPFSDFLKPTDKEYDYHPLPMKLSDTLQIFVSSGTTGQPKGICHTHQSFLHQCLNMIKHMHVSGYLITSDGTYYEQLEHEPVILLFSSMYWISAALMLYISILTGSPRVIGNYNPETVWYYLQKYKVSFSFLSPPQCIDLCKYPKPTDFNDSYLRNVTIGGCPLPTVYLKKIRELLPKTNVTIGYGQTEIGIISVFSVFDTEEMELNKTQLSSCGRSKIHGSIKIVCPETEMTLGPYQSGEIRIFCDRRNIMSGYYKLDSSIAFDSNGFLKTGDIGYFDEFKCLHIVDRIKEMLKYRADVIAPASVEEVFSKHPAVLTSIVIGIPHPEDGDLLMGLVVLKDGYENTKPEDIVKFVNDRVSNSQQIRAGVKFINEVPTTPSMKPKRIQLRDAVIKGVI